MNHSEQNERNVGKFCMGVTRLSKFLTKREKNAKSILSQPISVHLPKICTSENRQFLKKRRFVTELYRSCLDIQSQLLYDAKTTDHSQLKNVHSSPADYHTFTKILSNYRNDSRLGTYFR